MALITCPDCGNQISTFAPQCPFCGRPTSVNAPVEMPAAEPEPAQPVVQPSPAPSPYTTQPPQQEQNTLPAGKPPHEWLIESIAVTGVIGLIGLFFLPFLLAVPFGIVALFYASKVNPDWYAGRAEDARQNSKSARMWTIITGLIFLLLNLVWIIPLILLFTGGFK